jgi:3D-(3,5/4)-trihydroxycyclohexane-1,2-dione acylhydrolase (decyclizing)
LQDFTTGSWTLFDRETSFIGLNAARFDAGKHRAQPLVCDAREGIVELDAALADWSVSGEWQSAHLAERENLEAFIESRIADDQEWPPSYAQLVGLVHESATPSDYVLTAAGGLPGELNINWQSLGIATFDCEYGFSCMGYEISGAWGAAFARSEGQVYSMVGDGSYLMMNSDIYASVLSGKKFILVVCDNGGYAVIERLQVGQGGASYNNMLKDSTGTGGEARVDFAAHAAAMGATVFTADSLASFRTALDAARAAERTAVIVTPVRASDWTEGGAFWQVGVPEVSEKAEVRQARASMDAGLARQRKGV